MGWRPDGWKNPIGDFIQPYGDGQRWAFELGADAMLKWMRKYGVFTYGNHTPDIDINDAPEVSGYWCFIPEENR